jgi:hypothetical protein
MINSTHVFKSKNGIYYIIVNIEEKWINYQINRIAIEEKIGISFFYDIETQPGEFEEYEQLEYIDIPGFYNSDYLITSMQEKDQITLICMPRNLIKNKFFKEI